MAIVYMDVRTGVLALESEGHMDPIYACVQFLDLATADRFASFRDAYKLLPPVLRGDTLLYNLWTEEAEIIEGTSRQQAGSMERWRLLARQGGHPPSWLKDPRAQWMWELWLQDTGEED